MTAGDSHPFPPLDSLEKSLSYMLFASEIRVQSSALAQTGDIRLN